MIFLLALFEMLLNLRPVLKKMLTFQFKIMFQSIIINCVIKPDGMTYINCLNPPPPKKIKIIGLTGGTNAQCNCFRKCRYRRC